MSRILRLRKHVLHALSVLSLLLCVATITLWVRSHWISHTLYYARIEPTEGWLSRCDLSSAGGLVVYHRYHQAYRLLPDGPPAFGPTAKRGQEWTVQRQDAQRDWIVKQLRVRGFYRLGFGFERHGIGSMDPPEYGGSVREWTMCMPHWFLALLLGAFPAWIGAPVAWKRVSARWRGWRSRPGQCPSCGYDLRATPLRCPECGRQPATTAT